MKKSVCLSALMVASAVPAWAKPASDAQGEVQLRGPSTTLQVIADTPAITNASPEGETPLSLLLGTGTGMYPQVNAQGDVLFGAHMWNGDPAEVGSANLYRYRAEDGVQYLIGDRDILQSSIGGAPRADLTSTFIQGYKPTITGDGEALTMCRLSGDGVDYARSLGAVRVSQGPSSLLAQNQTPLGSLPIYSVLGALESESMPGLQYIAASLNASATESVILERTEAGIAVLARTGQEAPETGGAQFGSLPNPLRTLRHISSDGAIAFPAMLTGAGVTPSNNAALYRAQDGAVQLIARDGQMAQGAAPDCPLYGTSYARFNINSSGHVAFNAGTTCNGIAVFSDRNGELELVAHANRLLDGPSGRFKLGLINEVTTALGSVGDAVSYVRGFITDNGDVIVLTSILHEDGSLRSAWGLVSIAPSGAGRILLESSAQHSALGIALLGGPFPEQISIAEDGTILTRVQEEATGDRILVLYAPTRGHTVIRSGDVINGLTVTVGGSNHVSGLALPGGKMLAMVTARADGDSLEGAGRGAIMAVNASGQQSLPVVRGITQAQLPSGESLELVNFYNPFAWTTLRKVANDDGKVALLGVVRRPGMEEVEEVVLLVTPQAASRSPADFNDDGVVDVTDLFAFLSAFFAMDMRADVDGDGVVATPDIFAFLQRYFAA